MQIHVGYNTKNQYGNNHLFSPRELKWILLITILILHGRILKAQNIRAYLNDSLLYAEGMMEYELRTGEWKYYDTKNKKLIQKGIYLEGKKEGIWESYFPEGGIQTELEYKNDILNGKSKTYHNNGNLKSSGTYGDAKKEGVWKYYHSNQTIET